MSERKKDKWIKAKNLHLGQEMSQNSVAIGNHQFPAASATYENYLTASH